MTPRRDSLTPRKTSGNSRDQEAVPRSLREGGPHRGASASVILDDPNLLFVNAGMVQFVPYFLGQRTPPYDKATSVQKCIRTPDIDEVGITTRHNTFFQMAGNFSFGDYFKRGAIELAWALLTNPVEAGGYGFDPEKLWATVYYDDDEAAAAVAGDRRPARRAHPAPRHGRQLLVDGHPRAVRAVVGDLLRPRAGVRQSRAARSPTRTATSRSGTSCSCRTSAARAPRKDDFEILGPLPRKNIDTGMGVERVACLLQGVDNVYETDLLRPVIDTWPRGSRAGATARQPRRRRPLPDHRRPQPHRGDPDRRRCHARQRGPRLRAAPVAAPDHPRRQAARRRTSRCWRTCGRGRARRDGPVVPGTRHRLRPHHRDRRAPRRARSSPP